MEIVREGGSERRREVGEREKEGEREGSRKADYTFHLP